MKGGTFSLSSPIRALVAGDDPDFRAHIGTVLESRGLECQLCADADTALILFDTHRQELLLLDRNLSDRTGLELTREIRKRQGGEEPLIILLTEIEIEESLEEALDSGIDDYIEKRLDPATLNLRLAIAVRRVLDARRQRARKAHPAPNTMTDPLTGLATRALLRDRIQGGIHRSQRDDRYLFAVLRLDLDEFRRLNDGLGEEVGDQILVETARRIQDSIRSVDTAARITADEFGVFLDDLREASDVTRVTNRIKERFAEPIRVGKRAFFVGASMGITLSGSAYGDPEGVLRDASRALRQAKGDGAGTIRIFDPVHHQEASARREMEKRIREALERDEMTLHYQPILSLSEQRIIGFEGLIRWPRPGGGFVPTEEFIPVAENSGIMAHLGWWTLEQACRQVREWHTAFPGDFPVAVMVNISGKLFSEPELVPSVIRILERTKVISEHLHLEITETSVMSDLENSLRTLRALKEVGVHLHVDDFGTGHSSLSYLHRFPVDSLKVDRAFVAGLTNGSGALSIVRTVVDLARSLDLLVVAEGVETPEQLELVRNLGCDYAQGWLFAKAMDPSEVPGLLRDPSSVTSKTLPI